MGRDRAIAASEQPPERGEGPLAIERAVLDAIPAAVSVCAADGSIVHYNRRAAELWGREPAPDDPSIRFGGAVRLYHKDDRPVPPGDTPVEIVLRTGEPQRNREITLERADGSRIVVVANVEPLRSESGEIVGAINCFHDITDRSRAEDALARRMNEQTALYRFTDRLRRAESVDDIWDAAFEAIHSALHCERASILLFDTGGIMRFVAWRGLSSGYRAAVDGHSPWTADSRNPDPIRIADVANSALPADLAATIAAEGIAALAFIPLLANDTLIGKFMVYRDCPHDFADGEIDLAVTIGRQLGFSVERLRAEQARLAAEAALRESDRRLDFAMAAANMGAWEWVIDTGEVKWSPSLEKIHGLKPGSFGGRFEDFARDIHPEDVKVVRNRIKRALAAGRRYHTAYRIIRPDGRIRWVEAFGRIVPDTNDRSRRIAGVCMDITERKQAEEAVLASERRFKALASQAPVGIFETDAVGNCLFVNERWRELAGLADDAALGRDWAEALHPEDRERVSREWYDAVRTGDVFDSEYRFATPDGRVSWLEGSALAIHDPSGAPIGFIGSVTDITGRKNAEEKQAFLINELNHRVKNTLATVQAIASQTFRRGESDPGARDRFEARLIALSNAHSILTQHTSEGTDIRGLIARALRALAAPDRIRLDGPPVRLSPKATVAIAMAMHELGTNAGKYGALSNEAGQISVTWAVSHTTPATFNIEWRESGGPPVTPPKRRGFGSRLIERNLAHDLDGDARIDFLPDGVVCVISTGLASVAGSQHH